MKAVILAGGLGTRLAEETILRPKPMVEIGGKPILWHIMNIYAAGGVTEFIIALGYKGEVIKEYFLNFYAINNDITIDFSSGTTTIHDGNQPNWKVHLVDTGTNSQTGGRLKHIKPWLGDDEHFMATYGDGVADINIKTLLEFHQQHGKKATMTMVRPPSRFGDVMTEGDRISHFNEKPQTGEGWINGGYFVLHRDTLNEVDDENTIWERAPLERLTEQGELMGYRHGGFWQPMDTIREKQLLESLWASGKAPWRIW